jgi:hypothetical protein
MCRPLLKALLVKLRGTITFPTRTYPEIHPYQRYDQDGMPLSANRAIGTSGKTGEDAWREAVLTETRRVCGTVSRPNLRRGS